MTTIQNSSQAHDGSTRLLPYSAHFLLNDKCNARCVFCGGNYYKSRSGRMMTLEKFKIIADNIHLEHYRQAILAGAGDPLLCPDFVPIMEYLHVRYPSVGISVTTNGIALNRELSEAMLACGVTMLNISLNAATRETYQRLMQVDAFDRICSQMRDFSALCLELGINTQLQLSIPIMRCNVEELPLLISLAHEVRAKAVNVFYCRFYPREIRNDKDGGFLPDKESLFFNQKLSDRIVTESEQLAQQMGVQLFHEPLFSQGYVPKCCSWTENELMIGFDGEVFPCGGGELHFKKKLERGEYNFGNALQQTIEEFWNNDSYRAIRVSSKRSGQCVIPECRECSNMTSHMEQRGHILEWADFSNASGSDECDATSSPPRVSVIVPTHNRPDMLKDAIQSVMSQTFQNFEIIVVNDAGQDTAHVITSFNTGKITYITHERNKGLAAARNTGIRAARGKYIAYLDDDDVYYANHLEELVRFLENNDFYVAYTDAYRAMQEFQNGSYVTTKKETPYSFDFDYDRILFENFIPVLCIMHRRECLEKSGYFDEALDRHEDWDLWIRMSRHYKFAHIPRITCEFTFRCDGSGMTSGTFPKFLTTLQQIYQKYELEVPSDDVIRQHKQKSLFDVCCSVFHFIGDRLNTFLPIDELPYLEFSVSGATIPQVRSSYFWKKGTLCSDQKEAITFLEKAITEDAQNHPARVYLVSKFIEEGRFTDAISILTTLEKLNPLETVFSITRKNLEVQCNQAMTSELLEHHSGKQHIVPLTDHTIKVSIIIPVFNQLPFTKQCLDGLFATLPAAIPCEIIVVDNGSSDGTGEYLHSLGNLITVLSNRENLGFAVACNQGARASRGELVLFLNNDTLPKQGWLEALIAAIDSGEADLCGARLLYPDGRCQHAGIAFDERGLGYHIFTNFPGDAAPVMERRFMQAVTGACLALRKSLFLELGCFDEGFRNGFEDVDLCLRAGEKGKRILYVPESVVIHYAEQSSGRKDNDIPNMQRFFALWQGKVRHDDTELYTRFGLVSRRETDGCIIVTPAVKGPVTVSIIIPLFNKVELTRACLLALERNTPSGSYELVLVDNGSSDGTAKLLAQWENKTTIIRNVKNLGFAAACNQGARAAKGDYLLFLNNDTEPLAGWLKPLLDVFRDKDNVGIVGSKLLYPDGTIQHAGVEIVRDNSLHLHLSPCHREYRWNNSDGSHKLKQMPAVTGACLMISKPIFETVGGFDESYWNGYEDVDLCFKVQKAGYEIYYQPASVVIHHESKSGSERRVRENDNLRLLQERWKNRITPGLIKFADKPVMFYNFASIIILTYNSANTILRCLDSVRNSLRPYDEVIIVDNGSKDRTVAVVEAFTSGLRQFKLIKNGRNLGFSAGTNVGISHSTNPYVVLLNPDTLVSAGWLDNLYAHFYFTDQTTGAVGPISNYVAGLQKMELYQQEQFPANATIENVAKSFTLWNKGKRVESKLLIGFCMMIRRTVLNELGMLDENLFLGNDDLELSWRLRANGYHLFVAADTFVYHEGQQSFNTEPSEMTKRLVQQSTDALYDKLARHYGAGSVPVPMELWGIEWFTPTAPHFNPAVRFLELKIVPNRNSIPTPTTIQPVTQGAENVRYPLIPLVGHSSSSLLQKLSSSQRLRGVLHRYTIED